MKNFLLFLKSFRFKVAAVCVFSICLAATLSVFMIFRYGFDSQFQQLREELKTIARTASLTVNPESLLQVPLTPDGIRSSAYQEIASKLRRIKKVNSQITYIYTMGKTDRPGMMRFLVDPDPIEPVRKKRNLNSFPGVLYDSRIAPEMAKAFDGATADHEIIQDAWGSTLSGYAPIYDSTGHAIAILGVDMSAEVVLRNQREIIRRAVIIFIVMIVVSILMGLVVAGGITGRIETLHRGIQRIMAGDLGSKVPANGRDEIGELARSFNEMVDRLAKSRKELEEYFYRVAQSFIRILEAKDSYTCGHSDRVGEYAQKIAQRMGFSTKDAHLLREAAKLHDIGKLKIDERILNKPQSLTEEEWEKIREHPLVGEDVLEPIILDKKMLRMVRHHHERYDGKGYPDKLLGSQVDLAAQIVSVADVFDAMTSPRAYRSPLNRKDAVAELKRSSGTQLNPEVVEVFCKILAEEEK